MKLIPFKKKKQKKIGLALGSGSARGWAHIGVLRALTEAGVQIDYIAGTSIGALVGAVFASDKIEILNETVLRLDRKSILNFVDIIFPKSGLIDGKKVVDSIRDLVEEKNIDQLSIPFCAISTNLATGSEVILKDGDILDAIRSSISVPGIFTPVRKGEMILVDGALVNPVPVNVVREMGADFVIAVNLNYDIIEQKGNIKDSLLNSQDQSLKEDSSSPIIKKRLLTGLNKKVRGIEMPAINQISQWLGKDMMPNIFDILVTSISIMATQITNARLISEPPDLLIQPKLGHIKSLEFNRAREAISEGYKEMRSLLPLLPRR